MNPQLSNEDLLENLKTSVILIDSDLVIRRVNISTETLFEQSRRYLVGMPLAKLITSKKVVHYIREVLANNAQFTLRELSIALSEREVLVDMTLSQHSAVKSSERLVLIEMHSINRIARFMKEYNQLERQQSFRLMMRGLAHEIKNPLGGIRGAAQILHRETENRSHQELCDILIKETDRLARLVDRVMGSRQQLKLEKINIHAVLEHVADLVRATNDDPIKIERHYDPTLPEILADKEQLIQAVLNIVVNAVEIRTDSQPIKIGFITKFERYVTVNHKKHKSAIKIVIWDSGPGVDEELREILFDPLISGRPEGSGLGLSITQEIIRRHEGAVQLEECEPHTCFAIYLPYRIDVIESHSIEQTT